MAQIADVEHAAFWVPEPARPPRAAALFGLHGDPVLASPAALRHVIENAARGTKPAFAFAAENPDLGKALDRPEGRFAALLAVPFRTPGGLQGLGVFYYGADTARPGPDTLEHLAEIPRSIAVALELVATLDTVKAAERALELALAGRASLGGLEHLVGSLETLRDRLGEIRSRPDVPPWFAEQYVRLAPALASALDDARSLLAFGRGEVRKDTVYLEDLLAELRTADVTVELEPAAETVARRRGAAAGGAARARRRDALARRGQLGAARDPGRGVDRRRAPDRALRAREPGRRRPARSTRGSASASPAASPSCTAARSRTTRRRVVMTCRSPDAPGARAA